MGRRAVCLLLLIGACNHSDHYATDSGPGGGGTSLKTNLDLTHVVGLALRKSTSPRRLDEPFAGPDAGDCSSSNLYAVQDDGTMVTTTVTYTPAMGDAGSMCNTSMSMEQATGIFNATKYAFITYFPALAVAPAGSASFECQYVVLRKSDGALFCSPANSKGFKTVKGDGDILYLDSETGGGDLSKLDMSKDPPTATLVNDSMSTGQSIMGFDVDGMNNVLADGMTNGMQGSWLRVYKDSGGILGITANQPGTGMGPHWYNPTTGDFYYTYNPLNGTPPAIGQTTEQLTPGTYTGTLVGAYFGGGGVALGSPIVIGTQAYTWGSNAGTSSITEMLPSAAGGICRPSTSPYLPYPPYTLCTTDADCGGGTCTMGGAHHLLTGVYAVSKVLAASNTLFVFGTDAASNSFIDSVDITSLGEAACQTNPGTGVNMEGCWSSSITPNVLLAPGDYSLGAVALSPSGVLTFMGVRFSDGASVVGNCTATACTVLSANAPAVSTLVRIN